MKIQELLTNMYSTGFNWMEDLEVKHYIPIMEKKMFVMDVISACTDEIDGFISADRFKMNIYFNMKVLELYTNLEVAMGFEEMVKQYDVLCENGTLNHILTLFADDYDAMCKVLENMLDELLIQNSIDMQVVKVANKIMTMLNVVGENLNKIDVSAILPDGTDITELINRIKTLN